MSTLAEMLAKMKADPIDYSAPLPLVDEAMAVIDDSLLSVVQKRAKINTLKEQATGYEASCFADVGSAFTATLTMDEIVLLNEHQD